MRLKIYTHIAENTEMITINKLENLANGLDEIWNTCSLLCINTKTMDHRIRIMRDVTRLQKTLRHSCNDMRIALEKEKYKPKSGTDDPECTLR